MKKHRVDPSTPGGSSNPTPTFEKNITPQPIPAEVTPTEWLSEQSPPESTAGIKTDMPLPAHDD